MNSSCRFDDEKICMGSDCVVCPRNTNSIYQHGIEITRHGRDEIMPITGLS